jgi:hypothetical protein
MKLVRPFIPEVCRQNGRDSVEHEVPLRGGDELPDLHARVRRRRGEAQSLPLDETGGPSCRFLVGFQTHDDDRMALGGRARFEPSQHGLSLQQRDLQAHRPLLRCVALDAGANAPVDAEIQSASDVDEHWEIAGRCQGRTTRACGATVEELERAGDQPLLVIQPRDLPTSRGRHGHAMRRQRESQLNVPRGCQRARQDEGVNAGLDWHPPRVVRLTGDGESGLAVD